MTRLFLSALAALSVWLPAVAAAADSAAADSAETPLSAAVDQQDQGSRSADTEKLSAEPSAEARQEASERFQRGIRFYQDSDYNLALIEFERAYQIVPDYRVLYNIGQVAISLGRFARARVALETYLAEGGEQLGEERRDAVARDLEMLRGRTAHLTVRSEPAGAEVLVDDVNLGTTPLDAPLLLDAGEHRVVVRKAKHVAQDRRITLAGAEQLDLELELEPIQEEKPVVILRPEPPVSRPSPAADRESMKFDPVVIGWTTTGVLAGGAVMTGLFGLSAARELDEMKQQPDPSQADLDAAVSRAEGWILATDILAASSAIAAGVSLYLMFSGEEGEEEFPGKRSAGFDLRLRVSHSNVSLIGQF